jgi:hypothetical protein
MWFAFGGNAAARDQPEDGFRLPAGQTVGLCRNPT